MALDAFADEEVPQEDIIDEEELVMLKELKDLKRLYRDNFSKLKGLKQEMANLQANIDASKEQIIFRFENWYADNFEQGPIGVSQPLQLDGPSSVEGKRTTTNNFSDIQSKVSREDTQRN